MVEQNQSRSARRKEKTTKKKPIWKKILIATSLFVLVAGIGLGALVTYYIATAPKIDAAKLTDPFLSQVYDQNGKLYASLGAEKRLRIDYNDLPKTLVDAVTATEDSRFFTHHGIDPRRIAGAIKANITNGFGSEGASTITQQVVERSFLTPEKKIKIKVQEQWLALQLERKYSKEEIMEMYLNKIYYGSGAYGVAKASEIYFGKEDLKELTLPEAAMLAGLPQRPSAYNPFEHPDLMKTRMSTVLDLMVRHGKITAEQASKAKQADIPALLTKSRPDSSPYEAFLQQVRKEVDEKVNGANIYTDGLKIYTTLDSKVQDHVEFLLTDSEENPINYKDDEMQAGMVVLDTKNGAIRAVGGSRNNQGVDGYNFAINGGSQAGSTMKPIMAYGPAIEYNKWSTYQQINDDKPYKIGASEVRNYNRSYQGWMSMRDALSKSLNVPALKALNETGVDKAQGFAEGLGINFADGKADIRDAIGGTKTNVTPLQLAGAYRAFGNEGIYNDPYAVTKVEFPDGKVVELKPEPKAAMSDYTAYMVTDMLKTVMSEGTGKSANISDLPVAGKTGTTNLENVEGSPESWFSGYTTNYTISIWTGYPDKRKPLKNTDVPKDLFKNTMTEISKDIDTKDFVKPSSVVELTVEKGSNPARLARSGTKELFVKGNEPSKKAVKREKSEKAHAITGLNAKYDADNNLIDINWNYDSDDDVTFVVSSAVDGGPMRQMSTTRDDSFELNSVRQNATYKIQVVAVRKSDNVESAPASVSVKTGAAEEETEDVPGVNSLDASYESDQAAIDVSWDYDGPSASFEVSVSPGGNQTVSSNGLTIGNAKPGQTYTITVTPKTTNGQSGKAQSTSITIPNDEVEQEEIEVPEIDEDQDQQEEVPIPEEDQDNENNQNNNNNQNQNQNQNNNQNQNQNQNNNGNNGNNQQGNSNNSDYQSSGKPNEQPSNIEKPDNQNN